MGSFAGATVWRLHKQAKSAKKAQYSILKGHSMCENCQHRLAAKDLVPLLSWIELRGRCRYCQSKIGWSSPVIELATAGLFVLFYNQWPYSFSIAGKVAFGVWLATIVILVMLAVYDLRWMLLPDRLVWLLTVVSVVLVAVLSLEQANAGLFIGPTLGALALSGLFFGMFQLSDGKWIGGGDVKMAVALGLIAGGVLNSLLLLFIASLLGSLVGVPLLLKGKAASHKVPFGPFLITATFIVFLWGTTITDWYMRIIGV